MCIVLSDLLTFQTFVYYVTVTRLLTMSATVCCNVFNILNCHIMFAVQNGVYLPYVQPKIRLWKRSDHNCSNCELRPVQVVDEKGNSHGIA